MRLARFLFVSTATVLAMTAGAAAQDYMADPIYDSPMFNFEGFYAGVQAGGASLPGPGIVGSVGDVAGVNFTLIDGILAALEFQGDGFFNGAGYVGYDALLLARVGTYLTQDMMVSAALGAGLVDGADAPRRGP